MWMLDFFELICPNVCGACGNPLLMGEHVICTKCESELPFTNFYLDENNPVSQLFWGRVYIQSATALLFFHKKGRIQHLLHQLKYNGKQEIGFRLGQLLGNQIVKSPYIKKIDIIVPIPLHPKRLQQRGYNQATCIANGTADVLQIPVDTTTVIRAIETSTQTKKSRLERWNNVADVFQINNIDDYKGKHILLVDDVVTTGATFEACAQSIMKTPGIEVSIAAIAKA